MRVGVRRRPWLRGPPEGMERSSGAGRVTVDRDQPVGSSARHTETAADDRRHPISRTGRSGDPILRGRPATRRPNTRTQREGTPDRRQPDASGDAHRPAPQRSQPAPLGSPASPGATEEPPNRGERPAPPRLHRTVSHAAVDSRDPTTDARQPRHSSTATRRVPPESAGRHPRRGDGVAVPVSSSTSGRRVCALS
jgi:hypothetical protein